MIDYVTNGWPKFKNNVNLLVRPYWNIRHELFYADGLCLKGHKIVVPECMRIAVLSQLHAGHPGIVKCTQKAHDLFYWASSDRKSRSRNSLDPPLAISYKDHQKSLAYFSRLEPSFLFFFTKKQSQKGGHGPMPPP